MLEGKQRNSMRNAVSTPAPLGGVLGPALLILVVLSCIAVIQSSHKSRKLFGELQDLRRDAMSLEEEWGRLLWASPDRVQDVAIQKLKMQAPKMREVKMVRGYGKAG